MAPPTKWQRQLKELAEAKKRLRIDVEIHVPKHLRDRLDDETEEEASCPGKQYEDLNDSEACASDQEGNLDDDAGEDYNITDVEDNLNLDTTAFEQIIGKKDVVFKAFKIKYQQESVKSKRSRNRQKQQSRTLQEADSTMRPVAAYHVLSPSSAMASAESVEEEPAIVRGLSKEERDLEEHAAALTQLEKKIESKREGLQGQNRTRHLAVLTFLKVQLSKQSGETREDMSFLVACCYGRGIYFAWKLVTWECMYLKDGNIPESRRGCFAKTQSWFNDEGIQLAAREWIAQSGEGKILHCRSGFELV